MAAITPASVPGRFLIAFPLSSRLFVHPDRWPRGSRFSPRSALAAVSSGPKRRLCIVHNGLVKVALCGPTASGGVACTLAPEGKLTVSALSLCGSLTVSCGPQRNGSPVRQMLCKITANLRARAMRALFVPDRLAICIAQTLKPRDRLMRVIMTVLALLRHRRTSVSPHFHICPLRSISPD